MKNNVKTAWPQETATLRKMLLDMGKSPEAVAEATKTAERAMVLAAVARSSGMSYQKIVEETGVTYEWLSVFCAKMRKMGVLVVDKPPKAWRVHRVEREPKIVKINI